MEQSLIDRDKLVESMVWRDDQGMISSIDDVLDTIDTAPTIDPESLRPRGHWEKETVDGPDVVKYTSFLPDFCSRCRRRAWTKSTYCPHCGAKMEG